MRCLRPIEEYMGVYFQWWSTEVQDTPLEGAGPALLLAELRTAAVPLLPFIGHSCPAFDVQTTTYSRPPGTGTGRGPYPGV